MPKVYLLLVAACAATAAACASNRAPVLSEHAPPPDPRTVIHVLNRTGFGPRSGDVERVQRTGLNVYLDEQLHPERIPDDNVESQIAPLTTLKLTTRAFASDYYLPMVAARQEFTNTQKLTGAPKLPYLRWHLMPIAAMSLPGEKPVNVLQQSTVTPEELRFQRENQQVFDELQAHKLLRAVYSERQLQEVLTDFWFNHFNVDARKIEDRPVMVEYERDVIRPRVLGKFRDLLEADAKSPAMLFYLDNWLSAAPPAPPKPKPGSRVPPPAPKPAPSGRGLNENYGRELMELHTLGVDGGYKQKDVVEVARCFTGWTMKKPHEATGFEFDAKMHDHGEKRVLGHKIKAGRGIEDGEEVLDILARHPSTAHFIATKLVRRFVSDDPPKSLVDRVAKTFLKTDGDLREVMRTILTSPEFYAPAAYRAKVKTPFEYVASALRATNANITNVRSFVGTIAAMGEPLYQCQPPTGYGDRQDAWVNTGALFSRLNFAHNLATSGNNAAKVDLASPDSPTRFVMFALADDVSAETRAAAVSTKMSPAIRTGLLLGSPEFQHR
jgi:uncharacterized protein (DUF1800 family)